MQQKTSCGVYIFHTAAHTHKRTYVASAFVVSVKVDFGLVSSVVVLSVVNSTVLVIVSMATVIVAGSVND
jgi:hypothetical protein